MTPRLFAAALACTLLPTTAAAQIGGWAGFNGGIQTTATDFRNNVVFTEFHEDADFTGAYAVDSDTIFDGGAGIRLASGLGFGVGVSRFKRLDPVAIDARVPHPFFFNRPRLFSGGESGFSRLETAVHVEVRWYAPLGDAVEVAVFGGPTLFNVRQDVATAIGYDHAYPYDEASLSSVTKTAASVSAYGFHAGADVGFYFSEAVGLGALVRYSAGTVDLSGQDAGAIPADVGGLHVGGGLRLRF